MTGRKPSTSIPVASEVGRLGNRATDLVSHALDPDGALGEIKGARLRKLVGDFQRTQQIPPTEQLDSDTEAAILVRLSEVQRVVRGRVLYADLAPAVGVQVTLLDRDLRTWQELGSGLTDGFGEYEIRYHLVGYTASERGFADVAIQITDADANVVHSPSLRDVVFQAHPTTELPDVVLPSPGLATEFERISADIQALIGELAMSDLTQTQNSPDVEFISLETNWPTDQIAHRIVAERLGNESGVPSTIFYGLLRDGVLFRLGLGPSINFRLGVDVHAETRPLLLDLAMLEPEKVASALERAVATRTIPRLGDRELSRARRILAELRGEADSEAAARATSGLLSLLAPLMDQGIRGRLHDELDSLPTGSLSDTIAALEQVATDIPEDAEVALGVATMVGFDRDVLETASMVAGVKRPRDLRRLARLAPRDWRAVLKQVAERKGSSAGWSEESIRALARSTAQQLEIRYPTEAFIAQATRGDDQRVGSDVLNRLCERDSKFDLASTNLQILLGKSRLLPRDNQRRAQVLSELKKTQRIFKLAPNHDQAMTLLDSGFRSAADLHAMGESHATELLVTSGTFTTEEASAVFQAAQNAHVAAGILALDLHAGASAASIGALSPTIAKGIGSPDADGPVHHDGDPAVESLSQKIEAVVADFPSFKNLFQSADTCVCRDCRSITGPAAYLADVLHYLKHRRVLDQVTGAVSPLSARDHLFARRPDLALIDLNCENANTPVPYIDLVNELLEDLVATETFTYAGPLTVGALPKDLLLILNKKALRYTDATRLEASDSSGACLARDLSTGAVAELRPSGAGGYTVRELRQTTWAADRLTASPEYVNDAAYAVLAASPIAFHLPFDMNWLEIRAYLGLMEIDRAALMETFQTQAVATAAQVAAERLGIADAERQILITPAPTTQASSWATPAPAVDLRRVDRFLDRTGLEYEQLLELLNTRFVNPHGTVQVVHLDDSCDAAMKELTGLDDSTMDAIHRFLRLSRHCDLTVGALDRFTRSPALGAGLISDELLVQLDAVVRLRGTYGLLPEDLAVCFDGFPSEASDVTYAAAFLNEQRSGGSVEPRLHRASVLENEKAEAASPGTGVKLQAVAESVAVSLGTSATEIELVAKHLGDPPLSFRSLSSAFAHALVARALSCRPQDVIAWQTLTKVDPFKNASQLLAFMDQFAQLGGAGSGVEELTWWLRNVGPGPATGGVLTSAVEDAAIQELAASLAEANSQAVLFDNSLPAADQAPAVLASFQKLRKYLPDLTLAEQEAMESAVANLLRLIEDSPSSPPKLSDPTADWLEESFGAVAKIALTKAATTIEKAVTDKDRKSAAKDFVKTLLPTIEQLRWDKARLLSTADVLNERLGATNAVGRGVLASAVLPGTAKTLLAVLADDKAYKAVASLTEANLPQQFRALRLAHKTIGFLAHLGVSDETSVTWLLANSSTLGWLPVDTLPFEAGMPPADFAQWSELRQGLALFGRFPETPDPADSADPARSISMRSIFDAALRPQANASDLRRDLSILTGWSLELLTAVDLALGLTTPATFAGTRTFEQRASAIADITRLRSDPSAAIALAKPALSAADRICAASLARARYAHSDWLHTLKTVQDPIREAKRDALVAYLLAVNPGLTSSNDLYDHLLVDVQMSACQPSSRIACAHGVVQLFTERCLTGLEPKAVADTRGDSGWSEWERRSRFQVHAAAVKTFLYPENWLLPQVRDDKSPLFRHLEDTLLQDELTDRAVEDSVAQYLEQLDEIAFLEVVATHYEVDRFTMHVFARTKGGDPTTYFYRRLVKERNWTPWEKVDVGIEGDHLLAFMRNQRLYLAWPSFLEQADPEQKSSIPSAATGTPQDSTAKRHTIRLVVSEFNGRRWLPPKKSPGSIDSQYYDRLPDRENYWFTPLQQANGEFHIVCGVFDNGTTPTFTDFTKSPLKTWRGEYQGGDSRTLGTFLLNGCQSYPEALRSSPPNHDEYPRFENTQLKALRHREDSNVELGGELAIKSVFTLGAPETILRVTPGTFRVTTARQMTDLDQGLMRWMELLKLNQQSLGRPPLSVPLGTMIPFFFEDGEHNYIVIPSLAQRVDRDSDPGGHPGLASFSTLYAAFHQAITLARHYLESSETVADAFANLANDERYPALRERIERLHGSRFGYQFRNFDHPLACELRVAFNRGGLSGLYARETQLMSGSFDFQQHYLPADVVASPYPSESVEFDRLSAYGGLNWEIFLHIPMLLATKHLADGSPRKARKALSLVIDLSGEPASPVPNRYWVTKPFYLRSPAEYLDQRIDSIVRAVASDPSGSSIADLRDAVEDWRADPFNPHAIARSRTVAYQVSAVLLLAQSYIDESRAEAESADSLESLTRATLPAVLAERLLGPKPRRIPPKAPTPALNYHQLEARLDLLGNALVELENVTPALGIGGGSGTTGGTIPAPVTPIGLYFCIPPNDRIDEMRDTVADLLWKLRHCQDLDGNERTLALYAPPIDPGQLIKAQAAGADLSDIIGGGAPLPPYRFTFMIQKAVEFTQLVTTLGGAVLQAIEKRDAEELSRLRSTHEMKVLEATKAVREQQVLEMQERLNSLQRSREVIEDRRNHYASLPFMNAWEIAATATSASALLIETGFAAMNIGAAVASIIPQADLGGAGVFGSPLAKVSMGGQNLGPAAENAAKALEATARVLDKTSALAATQGSYQWRSTDHEFQVQTATKELDVKDRDIAAAQLGLAIAQKEVKNQELLIEQSRVTDELLRAKFTNQELYDHTRARLRVLHFGAYRLALDLAKRAERCYRDELGSDETFIQPSYADATHQHLLAGEHLVLDLRRMEAKYYATNTREFEITKHVSLAQIDPHQLLRLRATGSCDINIPEVMFDLDFPGHYRRRIRSVSLSIPCITGPYTTVSAKLSLVSSYIRKEPAKSGGYLPSPASDPRFSYPQPVVDTIATSHARDDRGVFEFSFRDERYLPFEGAGAVSTWKLELPSDYKQFDYSTIADAILRLDYTSLDGGAQAITTATNAIKTALKAPGMLVALIDLRRDLPDNWSHLVANGSTTIRFADAIAPTIRDLPNLKIEKLNVVAITTSKTAPVISINGAPVTLTNAKELEKATSPSKAYAGSLPINTPFESGDLEISSMKANPPFSLWIEVHLSST